MEATMTALTEMLLMAAGCFALAAGLAAFIWWDQRNE
jgi:hypothetical protein